ncbi:MAG: hypothetical protein CW338_05300 [Clostridiales bacterium]|nr:hypothetical protein [Clostridiales bacterium]
MNGKIVLLMPHANGEAMLDMAENILTEIAVSFGHSFSITREKIGEYSKRAWGAALTEETVEACKNSDAVLVGDATCDGIEDLAYSLNIPLIVRTSSSGTVIARAVGTDPATLNNAAREAFADCDSRQLSLAHVAPAGNTAGLAWRSALQVWNERYPRVSCREIAAPAAMTWFIRHPEQNGMMLFPPYAGGIFCGAADAVVPSPAMNYERAAGRIYSFFAPVIPFDTTDAEDISPLGMIGCVLEVLRKLGLTNEAECLETVRDNVLDAGWRTRDIPGNTPSINASGIVKLMLEQIEMAGSFIDKNQ